MATTTKTTYMTSSASGAPKVSLAEAEAADIRVRLAELEAKRQTTTDNIQRMNDVLHGGGWKQTAKDPSAIERVSADIEREHRMGRVEDQMIAAARQDLAAAELQITVDRITGTAERFNALMTAKTDKARNVTATCLQLCAMVKELAEIDHQAVAMFRPNAADTGLTHNAALHVIGRLQYQHFVEELIESQLVPVRLWSPVEKPIFGYSASVDTKLTNAVDGERTHFLANIALVLERITAGGLLTPHHEPDAATASMNAAHAAAARAAA